MITAPLYSPLDGLIILTFMSFLTRILPGSGGSSPKEEQAIRQDAVDKLCNRLTSAALLEDRRAAAQGLRAISKHHQLVYYYSTNVI